MQQIYLHDIQLAINTTNNFKMNMHTKEKFNALKFSTKTENTNKN